MEWYDFALYGFLAATIGQLFFPSNNPSTSLLASYGVFAAGFVMRPIGAAAFAALALLAWPLAGWMKTGHLAATIASQLILFALLAVPLGSAPAIFVELFPSNDRLTGYSISFNLGIGVLGGATPAIATWLIDVTDTPTVPAVLTAVAGLVAALALLGMTDRSREPLR